jgi:hypothetical protein
MEQLAAPGAIVDALARRPATTTVPTGMISGHEQHTCSVSWWWTTQRATVDNPPKAVDQRLPTVEIRALSVDQSPRSVEGPNHHI